MKLRIVFTHRHDHLVQFVHALRGTLKGGPTCATREGSESSRLRMTSYILERSCFPWSQYFTVIVICHAQTLPWGRGRHSAISYRR